ncbi:unnamed protein product [Nippostrongylus brasiliensis]|uniref:Tudor domain-containing protein n=1 Tax=Nippostrongylus brasiliensis TaxID=27835 RepID=A0A0N4XU03_NIPBR|nr:unnamed protein product [Nippostrongylus brasiliensis]
MSTDETTEEDGETTGPETNTISYVRYLRTAQIWDSQGKFLLIYDNDNTYYEELPRELHVELNYKVD